MSAENKRKRLTVHKRKYTKTEIRRVLIKNEFSYADAGKEMKISRQAVLSLCYHGNLCDWVKRGKQEIREKRLLKIKKVFEDCYFCTKKAASKMGISRERFVVLLRMARITNYRKRSKEDCKPCSLLHDFTFMRKEVKFFHELKFKIEKQLDVSITSSELLVVLTELGNIDTQITIHNILENRRKRYGVV